MLTKKWTFWIDCGGTFTDIIAVDKAGKHKVHKLLSHSPHYESAVVQGITDILGHKNYQESIEQVRLGTTVATNAFLERSGVACALITTLGHRDCLEIRQQNRHHLFELTPKKVKPLYQYVTHIEARMDATGKVITELDEELARFELQRILDQGIKSLAISLLHSTLNPEHELKLFDLATQMGFDYISLSHQVSPLSKYIARTETAVIDSYLSPYLKQYTENLEQKLGIKDIYYMQSDGGLCRGQDLKGHNALLSGPAGGLIGAINVAKAQGFKKIIAFDMGGTSTDVAIYNEELSLNSQPDFYGLKLLAPMLDIHTVAAGGGSVLEYDNGRFKVGPQSAGAYPGPACYRNGGPLTITDANLFLKRINPKQFPEIFGPNQDQPLDVEVVHKKFHELAQKISLSPTEIATGFIDVAIETMSSAVRKISVEKGYDPSDFAMVSFGGAGGQLALKVAQRLNIHTVLVHPLSSVLSAYGIGQAAHSMTFKSKLQEDFPKLKQLAQKHFPFSEFNTKKYYLLKVKGSDHEVEIGASELSKAKLKFDEYYKKTFGVALTDKIECSAISLKAIKTQSSCLKLTAKEQQLQNFTIINENNTAIVLENQWSGFKNQTGTWIFTVSDDKKNELESKKKKDKRIELEIFYQRFQFIAEQMGHSLQILSQSINIKERNDFSCALFTESGELIANAPHIPVHLGSMDEAVKNIKKHCSYDDGDSFICNSPLFGGTHLPDITIITPIFFKQKLVMWVASRGHHADIGGKTPGSMPGDSKTLSEEGVIIAPTKIVSQGKLHQEILKQILTKADYPVRNYELNLNDIKAKLAANHKGVQQIQSMANQFGPQYLAQMSEEILNFTHKKTLLALSKQNPIKATKEVTNQRSLSVNILSKKDKVVFDFTGTSPLLKNNFNTPKPIVKATIMFVLRSMIKDDIPLNSGLMRAVEIIIPDDCMLNPKDESPVVAGNVETSQALCDLLFEAFQIKASSYGTMNNLSFGNASYQYYETLCGGIGATKFSNGTNAIQANMTNSLLTDPEVFEQRFPVLIELMALRHGSGGLGQKHGGDGIYRRLHFLEDMSISLLTQARDIPPQGLLGGKHAQRGLNQIEIDGDWQELPECCEINITAHTKIAISTPGGGGFGHPKEIKTHYIFSFGSNMDLTQIRTRCPSAQIICRARVKDKEIRYTRYSPHRKGGVADMYQANGHEVYGLIISINTKDLAVLDKIECDDNGYQRLEIYAQDDNHQKIKCYTYDVIDKKPDIAPTKVYEWLVYSGAYYLNASTNYLKRIRSYR
ncbi:MAG: 5-oxoprolinase [Halobacteriovoraceae bacterium]|nr:5-oxoprolinase [Halobacteriovoraceae bacterium]